MGNENNNKEVELSCVKNGFNSPKISLERQNVSLDEAMAMTGFGKFNILMSLFCGTVLIGMTLETFGFSYIIPASQCDLEMSTSMKGWVAVIPFVGFILSSHLWGWIADTKGRRPALLLSMSIGSIFSVLSSLSPEVYTFIVLRLCAAVFIAGGASLGYAYMGEFSPSNYRDKMIGLANTYVVLCTSLVPLFAWAILPMDFRLPFWPMDYRPWRLLICCYAFPYIVCSIIILMLPETPKFLSSIGKCEEALNILITMFSMNTGKDKCEYQVSSLADEAVRTDVEKSALKSLWLQSKAMFTGLWVRYSVLLCSVHFITYAMSNGFYIWLPEVINKVWNGQRKDPLANLCTVITSTNYINQTTSGNLEDLSKTCNDTLRTEAFTVTIIISVVIMIFTFIAAFSVQYIGKKAILIFIFLATACGSFALHWITNMVVSVILFSALQLGITAVGLISAFVVQIYPTHMRAMAICVGILFGRIGSVVFSKGISILMEVNCPSSFFTAAVLLTVNAGLTLLLPEKNLSKK